jgi:Flavoprotein.
MDQTLIDQIMTRVAQKLAEAEAAQTCTEAPHSAADGSGKPQLLILTQEHGVCCHQMLESARLGEHFSTVCGLTEGYQCDPAAFDTVILYGLTNEALAKIASGVCDTPYTKLASRALLLGKRIFVPREEVELYQYASTAPAVYYSMMEEKLKILIASGVTICPGDELESTILGSAPVNAGQSCCECPEKPAAKPAAPAKEQKLTKRVITERDIINLKENGVARALIGEKTILTDLARDLAKTRGIEIVRE